MVGSRSGWEWDISNRSSAAIGADFANRGAVTDDFVDAMQHLWYDEHPEFHGRFADFAGIDAYPRPVQQPIPIVFGAHSPPAFRRTVARGHGWYGFSMTPDLLVACLEALRVAATEVERPAALGPLEITVTPRHRLTADAAQAYAELGVDRIVPRFPPTPDGVAETIDAARSAVAGL